MLSIVSLAYWYLFFLCASTLLWGLYCRTWHPLSKVPGPFWASVTRLWVIYRTAKGDMDVVQRELHRRHGPLVRISPNELAVADPEAIRKIYRIKSPLTKTAFYSVWESKTFSNHPGLFTARDERVHSSRLRILNRVYRMSTVLAMEPYVDECCSLFVKRMTELAETGSEVDLGEWLQWFSFDVIGQLFFGKMFGFMEKSADHESYIASLDTLLSTLATAAAATPVYRAVILGSSICNSKTRAALKCFRGIGVAARQCVEKRVEEPRKAKTDSRRDLMRHLLDITKAKGDDAVFGMGDVKQEAFVALFAGSDTTAIALRAVFYFLCKNHDAYKELQAAVDDAFENSKLSDPPRYAEAQQLPLLRATIKEAMRLHPSVGLTMPRTVDAEGVEIAGVYIPAGSVVGMNAAVVGRDKSIYGDDADKFRPQRWLHGDNEATMDRYSLVFGGGKRTCIGKNISLSEIYKIVPLVIRKLDIVLTEPNKDWETKAYWFNKQSGIKVKLRIRNN